MATNSRGRVGYRPSQMQTPEPLGNTTVPTSPQSEVIYSAVVSTPEHLAANSGAGSGKTTVLIGVIQTALRANPDARVLVLMFNVSIARAFERKLREYGIDPVGGNVTVKTMNALGNRAILDDNRSAKFDEDSVVLFLRESNVRMQPRDATQYAKVVEAVRNTMTDPNDPMAVSDLVDRFDLDVVSRDNGGNAGASERAAAYLRQLPTIMDRLDALPLYNYSDQLYRTAKYNLPLPSYDLVLVDEVQDTNPTQLSILTRLAQSSRLVAVGDPYQAIYAFRGAGTSAYSDLVTALDATEYPLSVTYRCPESHVQLAQQFVPHLQARDGAPDGSVESLPEESWDDAGVYRPGKSLILCRTNAPLVSAAYRLLRSRVPVEVLGRDIGTSALSLLGKMSKDGTQETSPGPCRVVGP